MSTNIVKVETVEELMIKIPDGFVEAGEKVHISTRDDGSMVISKLVDIEIDLPEELLFKLAMEAHKQDITLNELIGNILREVVETDEACMSEAW